MGFSERSCYFMPYTCPENSGGKEQWHGLECFVYHSIFLSSSMFLYGRSCFWHADQAKRSIRSLPFQGIPVIPQWDASPFSTSIPWFPFVTQSFHCPFGTNSIAETFSEFDLSSTVSPLPSPSKKFRGQVFTLTFSSWQVVVVRCSTNLQFGASSF